MEGLLDQIGDSLRVTGEESSSAVPHPRFSYYKRKYSASSQAERRKAFINAQKQKRYDFVQHSRCLAEGSWDGVEETEDMDVAVIVKKPERSYKNQLMLSEWLVDVPEDLEENWIVVPCPVGKRCLVVAYKGRTRAYGKNGYNILSFPSLLPGGCNAYSGKRSDYCLLDCIYSESNSVFYILDIMCWSSHPVFDSEAEFRFCWLQTKLAEVPNITEKTEHNRYKFVTLPSHLCTKEAVWKMLNSPLPFSDKLIQPWQASDIPLTNSANALLTS
ncbi:snurportin-1-like isoform X2 [Ornithodoros turicata]|uniref:snurportin-1-like isoform X2 n=1 Tax=Ornithodoros turicata TaxID=34597 RepID=UPI003138CFBC